MDGSTLRAARRVAGLTQAQLAARAGTSRETLSAYERGEKSPTLSTLERLFESSGFELSAHPRTEFVERTTKRGRPLAVPIALPRLPVDRAFASVVLPLHLDRSASPRRYDLADRHDRARVYEAVLREGGPDDIISFVDGALLIDLWDSLVLPDDVRDAWRGVVERSRSA
jgi:transcriptional regulator with XRE-family HTH domain